MESTTDAAQAERARIKRLLSVPMLAALRCVPDGEIRDGCVVYDGATVRERLRQAWLSIDAETQPVGDGHLVAALRSVLADRERELLDLKGPCSNTRCRLHYAHSGPCDTEPTQKP